MQRISAVLIFHVLLILGNAAFGQFSDDFSDGDHTNNPTWLGESSEFTVTGNELQSQSTLGAGGGDEIYLVQPSTLVDSVVWEFFCRLEFDPSSTNFVRIYLMADKADLTDPTLNGYFLQIGEASATTSDSIDLVEVTNGTETKILTSTDRCVTSGTNNPMRIRVERDNAGVFKLFADCAGGTNFQSLGQTTNLLHTSATHFGVYCKYSTASRWDKYFFDDFNVSGLVGDTTSPSLLSATPTTQNALTVGFDEIVDVATATNTANYSIAPSINISGASINPADSSEVFLTTAAFTNGVTYTLSVSGVKDRSDNTMNGTQTAQFLFFIPNTAAFKDVVINEIMYDFDLTVSSMPEEYVEIHNTTTNKWFELGGWTFKDATTTVGTLPSHVLAPGDYALLVHTADTALFAPWGGALGLNFGALNNTGDQIGLRDNNGTLIDTVQYSDSWHTNPSFDNKGFSLELKNPGDSCAGGGANWGTTLSFDGGTPKAVNSILDTVPDVTPPVLASVTIDSVAVLEVCFDESMNSAWISNPANYAIDSGITVTAVTALGPEYLCVMCTLSPAIDTGSIYTITVIAPENCRGLTSGNQTAQFALGGSAQPGDIVFTEIHPDPTPTAGVIPEDEFVEIFNATTDKVINLDGWQLRDRDGNAGALPDGINLLPGEFRILTSTGDAPLFQSLFGNAVGVTSIPSQSNSGDSLELFSNGNVMIDKVYYASAQVGAGITLERIDPAYACYNPDNWQLSTDPQGGTPGATNSVNGVFTDTQAPQLDRITVINDFTIRAIFNEEIQLATLMDTANYTVDNGIGKPMLAIPAGSGPCYWIVDLMLNNSIDTNVVYTLTVSNLQDCPGNFIGLDNTAQFGIPLVPEAGDLIINEILFNPLTGGSDYVELYNLSNKVLDLSAVHIGEIYEGTDSIFNSDPVIESSYLFLPQTYICLTKDVQFQLDTYNPIDPDAFIEMKSFPSYDDSDGECVIFTDSGTVIDRLAYLDDWHFPNLDDDDGVSLERLSFLEPTQLEDNWHSAASTVNYGTPGYKNSQSLVPGAGDGSVWVEPEVFSPDQDGVDDVLSINYLFETVGNNARVTIFDSRGRQLRTLKQNTLLSTEGGTFTWDGTDEDGKRADIGVYVILFESSNPNTGKKEKVMLSAVLAARLD